MTHDPADDGEDTDIDEHLIYEGPHGIHFDSLEGKWVLVGVATALVMVLSGSTELLALVGPVALGVRNSSRLPKLASLEPQPWWWAGGVLVGLPIGIGGRAGLEAVGVTVPDLDWAQAVDIALRLAEALT